jgi:hypothetical protein
VKRILSVILLSTAAGSVLADSGMQPGLWEMHMTKNVVDGQDTLAQMAGMNAKMQEQLAKMPAEQRAKMAAMMGQGGMGGGGMPPGMPPGMSQGGMPPGAMGGGSNGGVTMQTCVTPEMAKRDVPVAGKDSSCETTNVVRKGNRVTYNVSCPSDATKMTGTGEAVMGEGKVTTRSDMTFVDHGQTHHAQSEFELKFVQSDCGTVKPQGESKPHRESKPERESKSH